MFQFKPWLGYLMLLSGLMLSGCAQQPQTNQRPQPSALSQQQQVMLLLQQEWQGTPYKLGGSSKQGVDCSAFVQHAYARLYNSLLPRTTELQLALGRNIPLNHIQTGDLIFFKTAHKVRHVGMVFDQYYFLHASSSQGVIFSRLDNPYWSARILVIKRPFL